MDTTEIPATGKADRPRLRTANRSGVVPVPARLEDLLPPDHLARRIWELVEQLDLSAFYADIKVVVGGPGQAATDPRILVALWLYAATQGVTSARELARLCVEHLAYIWLCGGVRMNYHTLSDFRTGRLAALEALFDQVLGELDAAGLVDGTTQAQDGMRVRASAGAASFRREPTLKRVLEQAQAQVAALDAPDGAENAPTNARQAAARERAARERLARLEAALEGIPAARAARKAAERDRARVSSTDPQARVMKMADGGYRPAYNWQFGVDLAHLVITGVDVVNTGSDRAQMQPMITRVTERLGRVPEQWLVDGGFVKLTAIEDLAAQDIQVFAPVPEPRDKERERYAPLPTDPPAVAGWRERMGTEEAQQTYKQRSLVEWPNARARNHGVYQVRVRGLEKVRTVAFWAALTHNLLIWLRHLGQQPAAQTMAAQA